MTNWLPLELFDDEEYDCRSPQSWLDHGLLEDIRHPIPGEAFLPTANSVVFSSTSKDIMDNLYQWVNVAVTDYDANENLWSILTLDGLQRAYKIPRIYLMFKAEDPTVFAKRIKAALDLRNDTENLIRYEFYMDCMIMIGSLEIPDWMMDTIMKLASRGKFINEDNTPILTTVGSFHFHYFSYFELQLFLDYPRSKTTTSKMYIDDAVSTFGRKGTSHL